ncbi:aldehyde oxidase [Spirochaetia bacterium]|nr:aldehyde oxidase [Spirochaetia bacterium]
MNDSLLFVEDIFPEGCLYGLTIRSPVAKGRIKTIECPRISSPYFLIRAEDIPGKNQLDGFPVPVLAGEKVSYIGEPVALLVGPSEAKLEEYAKQCKVLVEEDEPSVSPALLAERHIYLGTADDAAFEKIFSEAKTVVRGVYNTGIQEHGYAEPTGAVAVLTPEAETRFTVHTATQWPFHVRRSVAGLLKIPPEKIVVIPTAIGAHLDGKIWYPSLISCHAALASFITKKPVRLMLTREEDFRFSPKRAAMEIEMSSVLDEGGEIKATKTRVTANLGAQGIFTDEILDRVCLGTFGVYKYGAVKIDGYGLETNLPPQGPLSGFGLSQGFFARERHIAGITEALGTNPAEWRKNQFLHKNGKLAIGVPLKEAVSQDQLMDSAAAMSGYYRKWAAYELLRKRKPSSREIFRGIGVALAYQGSGFLSENSDKGAYTVEVTLEKDGSLEVCTSMVSSNPEYNNLWRNIAVDILAVDPAMVYIHSENTGNTGIHTSADSGPSTLSRNTTLITRLMERCCQAIRNQRFRDPLPITVRRTVRPDWAIPWEGKNTAGKQGKIDRASLSRLSWGAAVAEVEIDPVSYVPRIRGIWLALDGGKILSEGRARSTLKAAVIQALGWAAWEELDYNNGGDSIAAGTIAPQALSSYGMPSPADVPPINIEFIVNEAAGSRGLGELPFSCVPAAYVEAVSQAMDHHFDKIPLTARDIWNAGKLKNEGGTP